MTRGLTQLFYDHFPVWLQNLGVSLYGLAWRRRRFGPGFEAALGAAQDRERLDAEGWRRFQTTRLRELLHTALTTVPFYQTAYRAVGLEVGAVQSFQLENLPCLPQIHKEDIRPNPERFLSSTAGRVYPYLTSGSTGTPLTVYMSRRTQRAWQALYEARCRNWAGVHRNMRRAMIGGRLVVPQAFASPPYWRRNYAESQLYLSAFHISAVTAKAYVQALWEFSPDYLVGYASAWFLLARFAREQGLQGPPVKAILTSSEKLLPAMRETLESAFQGPVFDAYSGVEACCLASECEEHRLHVSPDAGIVELLKEDGTAAPPGEVGEIVATGLVNFDQPLIRYRTGDLARLSSEPCSCGRVMPVLEELEGRLEDVVIGPDGRETVRFHGLYVGVAGVVEAQVIQEALDRIVIRVVPDARFDRDSAQEIEKRVRVRLGDVAVRVVTVDRIERTQRGKFKAVISHVQRQTS